jgi:membrane protein YdbS with pleckstrin-like domain
MIQLKTEIKVPGGFYWVSFIRLFTYLFLLSLLFGIIIPNASGIFGFAPVTLIFLGVPLWLIVCVKINKMSFITDNDQVTINSGVIFRHSNSIPFSRIQNIVCSTGPLLSLLHLRLFKIWTASPAQAVIKMGRSENSPSGTLILVENDAEWLKNFILEKQKL